MVVDYQKPFKSITVLELIQLNTSMPLNCYEVSLRLVFVVTQAIKCKRVSSFFQIKRPFYQSSKFVCNLKTVRVRQAKLVISYKVKVLVWEIKGLIP